jgi:hypothetical protein
VRSEERVLQIARMVRWSFRTYAKRDFLLLNWSSFRSGRLRLRRENVGSLSAGRRKTLGVFGIAREFSFVLGMDVFCSTHDGSARSGAVAPFGGSQMRG